MYRILIISTVPFGINGITNVIKNQYKNIDEKSFDVDFIFNNEPSHEFTKLIQNRKSKVFILKKRSKELVRYLIILNEILKKGNYDIVHIHGNSKTLALEEIVAKKNNIKAIIPHGHNTFTKYPIANKSFEFLFNKNY